MMVLKCRFAKDMSNKLKIFWSNRKIGGVLLFCGKRTYLKRIMGYDTGQMELEVGTLLLSNDKNSVITENVLSYFLCLSSKFEV